MSLDQEACLALINKAKKGDAVDELMAQPDIDGCLVGGASLVAEKFARICNFVRK